MSIKSDLFGQVIAVYEHLRPFVALASLQMLLVTQSGNKSNIWKVVVHEFIGRVQSNGSSEGKICEVALRYFLVTGPVFSFFSD
jgi:hypothetical protein